jgi:hypothetical protein
MRQEYTNSWIASRIEFCSSYFAQICTKNAIPVGDQNWKSNLEGDLPFMTEQEVFTGQRPALLESGSHELRVDTKVSPQLRIFHRL